MAKVIVSTCEALVDPAPQVAPPVAAAKAAPVADVPERKKWTFVKTEGAGMTIKFKDGSSLKWPEAPKRNDGNGHRGGAAFVTDDEALASKIRAEFVKPRRSFVFEIVR